MPNEPQPGENTYVIDTESAAEMSRLLDQDKLLTDSMSGLFSELPTLAGIHDVLDIACGPGGWVHDVAYAHPSMQVTGFDISKSMIEYAQAFAQVRKLNNAHFRILDATQRLEFDDASFDLVNARFLFGFMRPTAWPALLQECWRITRPGGLLRLTECEFPTTNSPAFEKLSGLFMRALYVAGQSFSVDGRTLGITPVLGRLLLNAGYRDLREKAHVLHASAGMEARTSFYHNFEFAYKLAEPFLIKLELITPEAFSEIYDQALAEMQSDDFCATWFYLTVTGSKP